MFCSCSGLALHLHCLFDCCIDHVIVIWSNCCGPVGPTVWGGLSENLENWPAVYTVAVRAPYRANNELFDLKICILLSIIVLTRPPSKFSMSSTLSQDPSGF